MKAAAPELVGDFHSLDELEYNMNMNSGMRRQDTKMLELCFEIDLFF